MKKGENGKRVCAFCAYPLFTVRGSKSRAPLIPVFPAHCEQPFKQLVAL